MKEGEKAGKECPECQTELEYFMGFTDHFSHTSGHYTMDSPMLKCPNPKCDYSEGYDEAGYEQEQREEAAMEERAEAKANRG